VAIAPLSWPAVISMMLLPLPSWIAVPLPPVMVPALRTVMFAVAAEHAERLRTGYAAAGEIFERAGRKRHAVCRKSPAPAPHWCRHWP